MNGFVQDVDLDSINAGDIVGFEYYTVGTTPERFNLSGNRDGGSQCGTTVFGIK